MKAYEVQKFGMENLTLVDAAIPQLGATDVLVKFRAASLNYRDLMFVKGEYNPNAKLPAVPFSDGAGEVASVGANVTKWNIGDRVCPILMQGWLDGPLTPEKRRTAIGAGDLPGVLREYGAFNENGLVQIPEHLSFDQASTLPCAAVTVWNALVVSGEVRSGDTVLVLGTGGVSLFALQLGKLLGARVLITSSRDEKLERAKRLGADETINYRTFPEWDKEILRLTGGAGVDHVIEVGGAGTLSKSVRCVRMGGHIAMIGVLSGSGNFDPRTLLMKAVRMQGILVGSRRMFEQMNEFIAAHRLIPVIDKKFRFSEAAESLRCMESGEHFGKIVIQY